MPESIGAASPLTSDQDQPSIYAGIAQEHLLLWDLASIVSELSVVQHALIGTEASDFLALRAGILEALVIERIEEVIGRPIDDIIAQREGTVAPVPAGSDGGDGAR